MSVVSELLRLANTDYIDIVDLNKDWEELSVMSSSKGNQRKWFNKKLNKYYKEQFFYQNTSWKDYLIESLSYSVARQLNTRGIEVISQTISRNSNGTYGVLSDNFCKDNEVWVPFNRILNQSGRDFDIRLFPKARFKLFVDIVQEFANIDITEYLLVMLVLDLILLNEDRHLNNFGVIRNCETGEFRVSPLFDFGLGLFEHDKRYSSMSLSKALDYVNCKPFDTSQIVAFRNLYSVKEYAEIIDSIIPMSISIDYSMIPNNLAREYIDYIALALLDKRSWLYEGIQPR